MEHRMTYDSITYEAALHSARISGYEPAGENDVTFSRHLAVIRDVLNCSTGNLTNPLILNMAICGDTHAVQWRHGIRAAAADYIPHYRYVGALLKSWQWTLEGSIRAAALMSEEDRKRYAWHFHDSLVCIEPFARGNGRTARAAYYMLMRRLNIAPQIIRAETAHTYYEHVRRYREERFAPTMRERGYMRAQ